MAVTFAPIDGSVLAAFRGSDERALEQIVRQEFAALHEAARAESEDDHSAARVVEEAFVAAWREREQMDSPESLEQFLKQAVHRSAVRERNRRAALHRFEAHEHVNVIPRHADGAALTADEVWARVNTVLHTPRPSEESTARIRADVSRHEAAAHVAKIATEPEERSSIGVMIGVAAVVIAAIAALAWFLQPSGVSDARLDAALAGNDVRVRAMEAGQRGTIELLDGSRVMMGSASALRIPPGFNERVRGVGLDGTASFTVAPGGERTFVVRAGAAHVRVTGTTFDVSAFKEDESVLVRVREGTVDVASGDVVRSVAAGAAVAVAANGTIADATPAAVEQALGWTDGQFVVVDRPLSEVVPLLNRWYRLNLNVADARLLERRATVRAPLTSSRQAIEAVEQTAKVKFGYQGEQRVLRDAPAGN